MIHLIEVGKTNRPNALPWPGCVKTINKIWVLLAQLYILILIAVKATRFREVISC
ncbi:hypothetical protein D3C74_185400 [compost metagenome]